jgi:hypothetical protein
MKDSDMDNEVELAASRIAEILTRDIEDEKPGIPKPRLLKTPTRRSFIGVKTSEERLNEAESNKQCTNCRQWKPIVDFFKDGHTKTGFKSQCKACELASRAKRRKNESTRASQKKESSMKQPELLLSREERHELMRPVRAESTESAESDQKYEAMPDKTLLVDLSKYPQIYESLVSIAEEEDRTPEAHVRWLLRKYFIGPIIQPVSEQPMDVPCPETEADHAVA